MDLDTPANPGSDVNAALFCNFDDSPMIQGAMLPYMRDQGPVLIGDTVGLLGEIPDNRRFSFADAGLDQVPIDIETTLTKTRQILAETQGLSAVVVDMSWGLKRVYGGRGFDLWGYVASRIAAEMSVPVLSLYNKDHMIEDQVQAAFRAHRQFLAPSGLYENPFWMPADLQRSGRLDEQLSFMLGRVVPDFAGGGLFGKVERQAAHGAAPDWLPRGTQTPAPGERDGNPRWHIQCLGQLTVYTGGRDPVEWRVPGSAPKKTRTLFAYLLQAGEKGVHSDRIGELLWPEGGYEDTKRARLHHTVTMLRKVLGSQSAVSRSGDYYRLNVPVGSWLDITSFEQLCRRAISLARHGEPAAALPVYFSAEQLYAGDLFEDLPQAYVETDHDDWCQPRRIWLREMAIRVQYDMSKLLRKEGRLVEALERTQRALSLDPTNEDAVIEAMRVFHAQGRIDAIHRQFKQYRAALTASGEAKPSGEILVFYGELVQSLTDLPSDQRETKVITLG